MSCGQSSNSRSDLVRALACRPCKAAADIGRGLGIDTIAEGVETVAQFDQVKGRLHPDPRLSVRRGLPERGNPPSDRQGTNVARRRLDVLLGEPMTLGMMAGVACVAAGLWVANRQG
jgi:hypothetical protein